MTPSTRHTCTLHITFRRSTLMLHAQPFNVKQKVIQSRYTANTFFLFFFFACVSFLLVFFLPAFLFYFMTFLREGAGRVSRVTVGRDTKVFEFVKLILRP